MLLISVIFQSLNANFLSNGNIVNLLVQGSIYMLLAMAEVYVLLLGEIDLSAGFVAGVSGVITAELLTSRHGSWVWWAACLAALAACAVIGLFHGTLITRIGLPSFVVTLAGLLGFQGVMLLILGNGGTLPIQDNVVTDFANGNLTTTASWIVAAVVVGGYGTMTWLRDNRRRKRGLVAPPRSVTLVKIGAAALAGVALTLVCNANRGVLVPIRGVPWVVLIVLGVLIAWTILLGRTRFGRYVYAIGGNAEASRRAGIRVATCEPSVSASRRSRRASPGSSTPRACDPSRPTSTAERSCCTPWRLPSSAARACSAVAGRWCTRSSAGSSSPRSTTG